LIVSGAELCDKLLIADSGTGVIEVVEDDELEDPPLLLLLCVEDELLELEEASAVVGVVLASMLPAAVAEDALEDNVEEAVEATVVEFPEVLDTPVAGVVEATPFVDEGDRVDTAPFEEAEVLPEVLCAAVLPLAEPCI